MTHTRMAQLNREHRILGMIVQGLPYGRIATLHGLTPKSISKIALKNGIRRGNPKVEAA